MAGRKGRVKPARERLLTEFTFYASKCLKIRTKSAKVIPFQLNKAQLYLDSRIEDQRQRTGKVRIVVLKGSLLLFNDVWCPGEDSNFHDLAVTGT